MTVPPIPLDRQRIKRAAVLPLTLPEMPILPIEVLKRFPQLEAWQEGMKRWRSESNEQLFRSIEALKLDRDESETTVVTGPPAVTFGAGVTAETAFGQVQNAGASTAASRADHTHGTPPNPVPGHNSDPNAHPGLFVDNSLLWAASLMGA